MKTYKRHFLLLSFASLMIVILSFFLLQQNALNQDTARLRSQLDPVIHASDPATLLSNDMILLPSDIQSSTADVIRKGAAYSQQILGKDITITEAFSQNEKIQGFISVTETRTSTTFAASLVVIIVLVFDLFSLILMVKNKSKQAEAAQIPSVPEHTEAEKYNFDFINYFQFPIFVFDNRGKIHFSNAAFGNEFPSVHSVDQFSPHLDFLNFLLQKMIDPSLQEKLIHFEVINADYEVEFLPLDNTSHFLVTLNDVTAYQNALQAQKELVANVSHELKTPIASIRGFAELLANSQNLDKKERKKFSKVIVSESNRLLVLVTDLLLLSKTSLQIQKEEINLKSLIWQVWNSFLPQLDAKKLQFDLQLDEISLVSNEKMLQTIFKNLIENAIFYTNINGKIRLELRTNGDRVTFSISNTGFGLTEIERSKIFDRFYRTKSASRQNPSGSGLGLAIVLKNVTELGGKIAVNSETDKETIFIVSFDNFKS